MLNIHESTILEGAKLRRRTVLSIIIILAIVVLLVLAACAKPAPAPAPAPPEKTWTLKWGTYFGTADWRQQTADHWASLIKERTQGRVDIKMYPANSLATTKECWMVVQQGSIDGYTGCPSMIAGAVPSVGISDIYFSLNGLDAFTKFWDLDGKAQALSEQACGEHGVKPVGCTIVGLGMFGCNDKFIKTLDDYKGLKIRASGGWQVASLEAWGASAVAMSTAEVYTALQRGVIDGLQTSTYGMYSLKYGEVSKYMTYTPQNVLTPNIWFMNLGVWDSFPEDVQKVIKDAFLEAQEFAMARFTERESDMVKKIETEQGAEVYTLPDSEAAKWRDALKPVFDTYLEKCGAIGQEFIDAMAEANR